MSPFEGMPDLLARKCGALIVIVLVSAVTLTAQAQRGSLRVVVSGLNGAPIPGATVTLTLSGETQKQLAYTDENGQCVLPELAPGAYSVDAELTGFLRAQLASAVVRPGATERVDLTLRLEPASDHPGKTMEAPTPPLPKAGPAPSGSSTDSRPLLKTEPSAETAGRRNGAAGAGRGEGAAVNGPPNRMQQAQQAFQNLTLLPPETSDATQPGAAGMFGGSGGFDNSAPGAAASEGVAGPLLLSGSVNTGSSELGNFGFRGGFFGGEFLGGERGAEFGAGQAMILQRIGSFGGPGFGGPGMGGPGPGGGAGGPGGMMPVGGFAGGAGQRGAFGGGFNRAAINRIRGAVSLNYHNSVFDARPYSLSGREIEKLPYSNANFNLTLGGPLKIPHIYDGTDKTFFFVMYGGGRGDNTQDTTTTVPTLAERNGDFSQSTVRGVPVQIFDPATALSANGARQPFLGNVIPQGRIDPIARGLLAYIPLPNLPGTINNFHLEQSLPSNSDRLMTRIDRRLTKKDNLAGSFFFQRLDSKQGQIFPDLLGTTNSRQLGVNLDYTHTFKPSLSNVLRFTFNRTRVLLSNFFSGVDDVEGRLGISGVSRDPLNYGVPTLTFTNFGSLNLPYPRLVRNQTTGVSDNLTMRHRSHTLTMGVELRRVQLNTITDANARGTFTFSGLLTSNFDSAGNPLASTGFDWADLLLGLPQATSIRYGSNNTYFRYTALNGFFQDNWRARRNLTLSLGVRYELATPPHELYNRMANLDIARGFTDAAVVLPDQSGPFSGIFPRALVETDWNNVAPRIGLAYQPFGNNKTIIRAGYGLFYNPSVYNQFVSQLAGQPPFAIAQNLLTGPALPLTLAHGFPVDSQTPIKNTYAIDRSYRIGYAQNWNVTIQRQLTRTWVLELGYIGGKGTALDLLLAPNRAPLGSSPLDTETSRRIGNAQGFLYQTSGASSTLHKLRTSLNKRFTGGLNFGLTYEYGKSIDNASNIGGGSQIVVQDDTNFSAERGLSTFDVRHRLEANYNYDLPFGPRRRWATSGKLGKILEGWTTQGSITLASGTPLSPRVLGNAINNSGTGANQSERPDATGALVGIAPGNVAQFFNTAAFTLPQPGHFGNAGRNTIPGPGSALIDASVGKRMQIGGEGRSMEIRWQASNLLNTPNFAGVNTTINSTGFGTVTSVRAMRTSQFILRYRF